MQADHISQVKNAIFQQYKKSRPWTYFIGATTPWCLEKKYKIRKAIFDSRLQGESENIPPGNEQAHTQGYRQHTYLFISTPNKAVHTLIFCSEPAVRLWGWNVMNVYRSSPQKTQAEICRWESQHVARWCPALTSFHPGCRQISVMCAPRGCMWFHWLVLQGGFTGVRSIPLWMWKDCLLLPHLSLPLAPHPH